MEKTLLQQLKAAATQEEKAVIMLDRRLAAMPEALQTAVKTAAIPHWFNFQSLTQLLPALDDELYYELLELDFVEQVLGRGHTIQEKARQHILSNFWQEDEEQFRLLSGKAADFSASQESALDAPLWQAEEIYHRLVSDQKAGIESLKSLATQWANFHYSVYEEIAYAIELAGEQVDSGRLTGEDANWTRLWQAKLALIFGRPDQAKSPLDQINGSSVKAKDLAAEVHQTWGDWFAYQGNEVRMREAWLKAYNLYKGMAGHSLDAYLIAEKMRQEKVPLPEEEETAETFTDFPPAPGELRFIDQIHEAWIEGVLEKSKDQNIEIGMARDSSHQANILLHRPRNLDHPVSSEHNLSRLFKAAGSSLLILGAPGSGKTITLLELLEELLQEARDDGLNPIPILFNLSSFSAYIRRRGSLDSSLSEWLASELSSRYLRLREKTRYDLESGQLILLLDGLDEVPNEDDLRDRCVAAINDFLQENVKKVSPCGIVVCSRISEYELLHYKLSLNQALILQPLNNRQIAAFFQQIQSPHSAAMQEIIQEDWRLLEALRSPLLLNLFPKAYQSLPQLLEQKSAWGETVESRRQLIFAAYTDTVLAKPVQTGGRYPKEKSLGWLTSLAQQLQKAGTSLFYLEEMQPSWLPDTELLRYRTLYGSLFGLILGLFSGLAGALIGYLTQGPDAGLTGFLLFALFGLAGTVIAVRLTTPINRFSLRGIVGGLIGGLMPGLIAGMIGGLRFGFIFGLGYFISISLASRQANIWLRENIFNLIRNNQPDVQTKSIYENQGCLYPILGIIIGVSYGLILALTVSPLLGLFIGLTLCLVISLLFMFFDISGVGIFTSLLSITRIMRDVKKLNPGSGIPYSMVSAIITSLLAGIFYLIPTGLSAMLIAFINDIPINRDNILPIVQLLHALVLVIILPAYFTFFGGLGWSQHKALRRILHQNGLIPDRLVPWLDEMTERGLLRRVGGGYIFIHRSLLEYFAGLEDPLGMQSPG